MIIFQKNEIIMKNVRDKDNLLSEVYQAGSALMYDNISK